MARKHIIRVLCDLCLADDQEVDAQETPPITIGSSKPRIMALCKEQHWEFYEAFKVLVDGFSQMAEEHEPPEAKRGTTPPLHPGQAVASAENLTLLPNARGRFECPEQECSKDYADKTGVRRHLVARHDYPPVHESDAEARALTPNREGDMRGKFIPTVKHVECTEPGCDVTYTWPKNGRPAQALGLHRRAAHGIKGPTTIQRSENHQRALAGL